MKRVIIIHGWEGSPDKGWLPWLKRELEAKGFEVTAPQLPDTANPKIENWIPALSKVVGTADENTYLVGHSMGCQAIARYLATLDEGVQTGGAVFVAGFFKRLTNLEDSDNFETVEPEWLKTPLDLSKVKMHLKRSVAIFSTNDPYVPLDNQDDYRDKLGSEIVIVENMQHLGDDYTEVPIILEKLLEIAK